MAEYPNAEAYFRAGDEAGARARVNKGITIPEWREEDSFVLGLWGQMTSRMAAPDLIRMRCRAAGLTRDESLEVWERVIEVDTFVTSYADAIRARDTGASNG